MSVRDTVKSPVLFSTSVTRFSRPSTKDFPLVSRALETNGKSLVDGLENLVTDVENSTGDLTVSLTDTQAFEVGENLAITEGRVIFRNDLFELIHYKPLTEKVSKTPLLIVPPWINKFYNLDLQPKNSFVKFAAVSYTHLTLPTKA